MKKTDMIPGFHPLKHDCSSLNLQILRKILYLWLFVFISLLTPVNIIHAANLVPDSSFENGTLNWTLGDDASSIDGLVSRTGSNSLKLINDGSESNHNAGQYRIGGVQAGAEYEYSVWVQGDDVTGEGAGGKPLAVIRWRNSSGTRIEKEMYLWAPYGTYSWRELKIYLQAPPNATQVDISFRSWSHCLTGLTNWDDVSLDLRDLPDRGGLLATYQAEDASSTSGGLFGATETNYSGSNYFEPDTDGAFIEWNNVSGGVDGGTRVLAFRYALEGNAKNWEVFVNGVSQGVVKPLATGQINSWASFDWEVDLQPGDNTIRARVVQVTAGPLIDRLDVFNKVNSSIDTVATPTIDPNGGTFVGSLDVTLQTTTSGATIYYTTDGTTPTTGSTQYTAPFTLTADTTVNAFAVASGYNDSAVASAVFTNSATGQQPYGGSPWAVPGVIEAEDYDTGGEATAYHDTTTGNKGSQYRSDDVDIWNSTSPPEGNYTGANATNEWLEYTVDVATSGDYQIDLRIATPNNGRRMRIDLDGVDVTGNINIPNTGSWGTWQTISATATLTAGQHILRATFVAGGFNFNWFDITETGATPTVATPTITPNGGSFTDSVEVTLQTTTSGATIYYTTDGTTPTTGSTQYTAPFTLTADATVNAFATASGHNDSAMASAAFTVTPTPTVATPTIDPNGGSFIDSVEVTLQSATSGATIYYTTDGTTPTTGSTQYTAPITLTADATVNAFATASGHNDSAIATAAFTVSTGTPTVVSPSIDPNGGSFTDSVEVTLQTPTSGATIYYTTDGTTPTTGSTQYTAPFTLTADATVNAFATASGHNDSAIATAAFTVTTGTPTVVTPTITPNGGTFTDSVEVTLQTATTGATIYYTTDGTTPTTGSTQYTAPFTLTADATVNAFATASGHNDSAIASADFTVTPTPTVATPTIDPNGGSFTDSVNVTLQTTTSGATIYYTTDGTTPTTGSTQYTAPFTLTADASVNAFAVASGFNDSNVATAAFTITLSGQQPYGGLPWVVPGVIEAEDYDTGGEATAYHDTTTGNKGSQYRSDDVDIWNSTSPPEGNYTGANATNEWLEYTVDVATSGDYQIDLRIATPNNGRQMRIDLDGVDVTGNINIPNTGSWSTWQTISATAALTAGQHVLRVNIVVGGFNLNWLDIIETSGTPTVATPTIDPNGGSFTDSVEVTLQTTTSGATIYYTTDGTTPTTGSTQYTAPFTLTADATVNAFATASGHNDSAMASAAFTIVTGSPIVATPSITPNGGSFADSVNVTLQTTTSGATIYYTTDGTTPTTGSIQYTAPFTLTADATVNAFAVASGYVDSNVATAAFTITLSGQQPYGGSPWAVPGVIEAEDYDTGGEATAYHDTTTGNKGSQYRSDDVDIWNSTSPPEGNYTGANATNEWLEYTVDVATSGDYQIDLRIATPNNGKQMRIDLDGVDVTGNINIPNTGSWSTWQTISATAALTAGQHVLRVNIVVGGFNLNWLDFTETGATPTVATPTIDPNGGSFTDSVEVTLQTSTSGATIYYTTDGTTPTTGSTQYTAPFTLTADATVNAFATASGHNDSAIATAAFTVSTGTPTVVSPSIDPNGGSFTDSVEVTLQTPTSGATIYYTTDGTTPTTGSTQYTAPFTLTADATVNAFATASGHNDSAISTAAFTITLSGQQPYGGSPWAVPGVIEAEDYDTGGEATAYHDTTTGNNGSQYRSDDVDIWNSTSPPEGYYTGANATNEWLEYTVDVATSGDYQINLRIATPNNGRRMRIDLDGVDVTGNINIPNTGDWATWQTISHTATLTAGQHVLRVTFVVGGFNFNWLDITQAGSIDISDNFNDGNANGWTPVNDSGYTPNWQVINSQYQETDFVGWSGTALEGGYHIGTYSYLSSWAGASNYQFTVNATPFAESGLEIGVMFHYQDMDNYYRVSFSYADGSSSLEVKNDGVFTTLARNSRGFPTGTSLNVVCDINNGIIQVSVNGEKLFSAYDTSLNSGSVALYCREGCAFDDVSILNSGTGATISISNPTNYTVFPTASFDVAAVVSNNPVDGTVEFELDGSAAACTAATEVWPGLFEAQCTAPSAGTHTLDATLKDGAVTIDSDSHDFIATEGENYISIGNSIFWGMGDLFSGDGATLDDSAVMLQGFQSNLIDNLNVSSSAPDNNMVSKEAVPGDTTSLILNSRLPAILERHPNANYAIMLVGTNDAGGAATDSGEDCTGAACNNTYKGNLQTLINDLNDAGITPIIVLVPPRFGESSLSSPYVDPGAETVNADVITAYNRIIQQGDSNPITGTFIQGPDIYDFYLGAKNRFTLFEDNLHPGALAHLILSFQLRNTITSESGLPFFLDDICVKYSVGGDCTAPTLYKQELMESGNVLYIDQAAYKLSGTIPSALDDGRWIKTADADLNQTNNDYLSFYISKSSSVYVAYDANAASLPVWLQSFTDTGLQIETTNTSAPVLNLYQQDYPTGTVTLGGADASSTSAAANYIVIVK